MQSHYEARFVREMGCTEAEWLRWLPDAIGDHPWERGGCEQRRVWVSLPPGGLQLAWSVLPRRVIALVQLPVLRVEFAFDHLEPEQRRVFMRRFDLYMQRGGG